MMKRPMIQINDEVQEMNDDELAEYEARVAKDLANEAAKEAEIKAKTEAKTAAEAKLVALGLDLDDLKALGL
jgi:predicted signal transduction protein with EAL and GGDEF domain